MKKGILYIISFAVLFFLGSCSPKFHCKRCPISSETKDSVYTIIEEKIDTTYLTDSTSLKLLVECDSFGKANIQQLSYLQNNPKVKIRYKTIFNEVLIACEIDSLEIYNTYKTKFKQEIKVIREVKEYPPEKYIPKFLIWVLVISLIANIGWLGVKLLKRYIR